MKRSGFLKALGVMIAAPSVVKAIPDATAVQQRNIGIKNRVNEAGHRQGTYEIVEIIRDYNGYGVEVYITPVGCMRVGDYLRCGKQVMVPTNIIRLPGKDKVILMSYICEPFRNEDNTLYTIRTSMPGEKSTL